MNHCYVSQTTGEIYKNLLHALCTIFHDMLRNPKCRTWKMFNIKKEVF